MRGSRQSVIAVVSLCCCLAWLTGDLSRAAPGFGSAVHVKDSPGTVEALDRAMAMADQGRLTDTAFALHEIMTTQGDRLLASEANVYQSATFHVRSLLLSRPDLLSAYREVVGSEAQRSLSDALTPRPDEHQLHQVADQAWLTWAGMQAHLLLAGLALERDDPERALWNLESLIQHPDLPREFERWALLYGQSKVIAGQTLDWEAEYPELWQQLDVGVQQTIEQELDVFSERFSRPTSRTSLSRLALRDVDTLLDDPLWDRRVGHNAEDDGSPQAMRRERLREQLNTPLDISLHMMPIHDGQWVWFNDGHTIARLDRNTGQSAWEQYIEVGISSEQNAQMDWRQRQMFAQRSIPDRRGVMVSGPRVFGVMGQASLLAQHFQGQYGTKLVALSRDTGKLIWDQSPVELGNAYTHAFFHGTPMAYEQSAIVMLRRTQGSGIQDVFLVAVDQATGEMRWLTHVSSCVTTGRYAASPSPQMVRIDNTVVITDNMATVARIDLDTGHTRWTRILTQDRNTIDRAMTNGSEMQRGHLCPPLVLGDRVLVAMNVPSAQAIMLDVHDGSVVRKNRGSRWGLDSYKFAVDGDVLLIQSANVTRLDGETLSVKWSQPISPLAGRRGSSSEANTVTFPGIGRDVAVLPTDRGLTIVRLSDGQTQHVVPSIGSSHVLVMDGQLVTASGKDVKSYMSWQGAYDRLQRSIANDPANPVPAVSLASIAAQLDKSEVAIKAVDQALSALAQVDAETQKHFELRKSVFQSFLNLAELDEANPVLRGRMLDRVQSLAVLPEQRLTFHMVRGEMHTKAQSSGQAMQSYQNVLDDSAMREAMFHTSEFSRRGDVEAIRRMGLLIESHGQDLYASFDGQAQNRYQQLTQGSARSPQALAEISEQYPFSDVAPRALLEAGAAWLVLNDRARAFAAFESAIELANPDEAVFGQVVIAMTKALADQGDYAQASATLSRIEPLPPTDDLQLPVGVASVSSWLESLRQQARSDSPWPRWRRLGEQVRVISARPVLTLSQDESLASHWQHDTLPVIKDGKLALLELADMNFRWEGVAVGQHLRVLWQDQESLWLMDSGEVARILRLSLSTGEFQWIKQVPKLWIAQNPQMHHHNGVRVHIAMAPHAPAARAGVQIADDRPWDASVIRQMDEVLERIHCDGKRIIIADHQGSIRCYSMETGLLQWDADTSLTNVRWMRIGPGDIAIYGDIRQANSSETSSEMVVLDLATGAAQLQRIEWDDSIVDARVSQEQMLVMTDRQVTAYRMDDQTIAWRTTIPATDLTAFLGSSEQDWFMTDEEGSVIRLSSQSGQMLGRLALAPGPSDKPVRMAHDLDQRLTWTRSALMLSQNRGQLQWRDAIVLPRKHFYTAVMSRSRVIVVADEGGELPFFGEQTANILSSETMWLLTLDRDTGRLIEQSTMGPVTQDRPLIHRYTRLADGWLLLSNGMTMIALQGDTLSNEPLQEANDITLELPESEPESLEPLPLRTP